MADNPYDGLSRGVLLLANGVSDGLCDHTASACQIRTMGGPDSNSSDFLASGQPRDMPCIWTKPRESFQLAVGRACSVAIDAVLLVAANSLSAQIRAPARPS